ncbi:hypothetical protein B0O99DRAFT_696828 [Bisporella sp. PMI_857]|nr:hypothetical protein B0O99DRAFT_696828 [Bisporella sp. PMI_857]
MRDLVRPAADNKLELKAIHEAFRSIIRGARKVAVTEVIGQAALFEAHRKKPGTKPKKLFNSRIDKTTFKQYTNNKRPEY